MEINELFEKFMSDSSFKEEVESITDENSYNEFAKKYAIPYSLEEIKNYANDKAESANCETRSFSSKTFAELDMHTPHYQERDYHPLIVTWGNSCKLSTSTLYKLQLWHLP